MKCPAHTGPRVAHSSRVLCGLCGEHKPQQEPCRDSRPRLSSGPSFRAAVIAGTRCPQISGHNLTSHLDTLNPNKSEESYAGNQEGN
jgi:hypothetical protein